ncbi:hypothetical protein AQUCO_04400068v1 [Aquilegia coerulea]|uniref:SAM-dependent MTase DRM-type domain-containing protein n=1 Tax=Aquilegia coerulea TaxID=218851 RepID=A0A2G5CP54_AQUCA|nr:hypothetical protein AQUCO_04400068v1 [Aquilegia coerulea]
MGFSKSMVVKAIDENGESNLEVILETLLTVSEDGENMLMLDKEGKLLYLIEMGFPVEEASSAIDAYGPDSSVMELLDFIYASQMAKTAEKPLQEPPHAIFDDDETGPSTSHVYTSTNKKRKNLFDIENTWKRRCEKKSRQDHKRAILDEDGVTLRIPVPMIGFGIPNDQRPLFERKLPGAAIGPPYFYYENVACTPKGVWDTISRFLYEIKPEFVDSVYFSAAARKRGYIHNLPIHNRYPLMPIPPLTVQEALPSTKKWWPSWDKRTKLNCLRTRVAPVTQKLRDMLERCDGVPSLQTQKDIVHECKQGNLVWVGKNRLAPLEPHEMEIILGYPENHTRGGGTPRNERYNALGNSFQVDTVAYHLSVLKNIFPNGITVLSLFSGIGGAEVALHRLSIPLKNVVSVEKSEINRNILRSWWEQTDQKGNLIEIEDVEQLTADKLEHFINLLGGFDLIVGGSPWKFSIQMCVLT